MTQRIIPLVEWQECPPPAARRELPVALLINPPLWSAYAPYLAIPLLAGALREQGKPVQCLDLNVEFLDLVLSSRGLAELGERLRHRKGRDDDERFAIERARLVLPSAVAGIDAAKRALRDTATLQAGDRYGAAHVVLRDALWVISAAFEDLSFDLTSSEMQYLQPSSRAVLAAAEDGNSLYRWAFDKILPQVLEDRRIGLVGISITAETQLTPAITAAKIIKTFRPDIKVVAGGNYTTRMLSAWEGPLYPFADLLDYCILYEGEQSLVALYERLFEQKTGDVPGLVELSGDSCRTTPPVKVSLKHSAKPAYDLMPVHKYLAPGPVLPVYASRGCAWKCNFCSIPYASGSFRMRTPEEVAREVLELCEEHGTRYFMFVDEIMTLKSLREVSRELIKLGSPVYWYAETRFAKQWTREDSAEMYAAGCRRLDFGLESYNQRILDLMRKEVDVSYIRDNIDSCLAAGISVHLFAMFGFPSETMDEARNTVAFCEEVERVSRETYGNPYSSWGASEFTIDIHSPVGQRPADFGVRLLDPAPGNDLQLWRAFEYVGAETASAGAVSSTNRRARHEQAISAVARFHMSKARVCEEEVFLRNCLGLPFAEGISRPARAWSERDYHSMVRLGGDVQFQAAGYSVLSGRETAVTTFYTPRTGYVVECPPAAFDTHAARQWQAGSDMQARFERAFGARGASLFQAMCRFGLIESQAAARSVDWTQCDFDVLCAEDSAVHVPLPAGGALLVSTVTGLSVELGPAESLLWSVIQGEGLASEDLVELLGSAANRDELTIAIETLVKHGFCYVQAAEAVAQEELA